MPVRDVPVEVSGETVYVSLGERRYRILGLGKNLAPGVLRVNVMVTGTNTRGETRLHVDTLDLYAARLRAIFAKQAAKELGHKEESIERELSTLVLKLEDLQHEWMEKTLKPQEEKIEMRARRNPPRSSSCAIRSCSNVSSRTSSGAAWWEKRPTSW